MLKKQHNKIILRIFILDFFIDDILDKMSHNGSADLRSSEKEAYFRSWDFAHHQIYKSILNTQKLIKKP